MVCLIFFGAMGIAAVLNPPSTQPTSSSPAGSDASQASAQPTSPSAPSGPLSSFSDGTYRVGSDIAPGLYHTDGGSTCYWARLRSLDTASVNAIITNDNAAGPLTVLVKKTDTAFQTQGCGTWSRGSAHATSPVLTSFGDGTYVVGREVAPGTYRTLGGDNCYWARLADAGGATTLANDNATGPVVVTLLSSDGAFQSKGCGTWSKVLDPTTGGTGGATRFGDGTWRVGVDIAPGTYYTDSPDGCYYADLSGFSGDTGDMIDNNMPTGPISFHVDSNEVVGFQSKGCGTWTIEK